MRQNPPEFSVSMFFIRGPDDELTYMSTVYHVRLGAGHGDLALICVMNVTNDPHAIIFSSPNTISVPVFTK